MQRAPSSKSLAAARGALSEKEKQTLRLIVRGHDAKSIARHLGLSIHTVNERLRDARRKLEVPSSREAARLLFDAEGADPEKLVDYEIGEATARTNGKQGGTPETGRRSQFAVWIAAGAVIMLILGLAALSLLVDGPAPPVATSEPRSSETSVAAGETDPVRSARLWLELSDQGRWKDGWLATAGSFRKQNTVEQWAAAAEKARTPLGAVISRTALSQESVPAPPAGVEVVKFRTRFANKPDAIETVSLAREGADWRVVGVYID